ncbi:MAG TPA: zf-HC2 domain-containing protein [Terracidiphilus sp.]|nr:zf-HC2 domain-containing protein [Terracidiphilus sp.]
MTDHLSPALLSAFADGELSTEQVALAKEHLDACLTCASSLIDEWLLKAAVASSGRRYAMPAQAEQRMLDLIARNPVSPGSPPANRDIHSSGKHFSSSRFSGWAAAAAVLFIVLGWSVVHFGFDRASGTATESSVQQNEALDLHVAMLAANQPQVLSSDRHTVKPWFQGKLPFSFNLPENLPSDIQLIGADLAYLDKRPAAQLIFSIGHHRVSVFIGEREPYQPAEAAAERSGFQMVTVSTTSLEMIAVSDAERSRLAALAGSLKDAQSP